MENKILLKANIKQHKGVLLGIFILTLLVAAALGTVLTIWSNSQKYIKSELDRAGFGELTVWVENLPNPSDLENHIETLKEIEHVETQHLIYSNYTTNEIESDVEGQLITYSPNKNRYRFFTDDLLGYVQPPSAITPGEVYVSPSMISICGIQIGDKITFPIARSGKNLTLTVKGFYEDIFMGSSMIGMKGFLISESDRYTTLDLILHAGIDAFARDGAMLHIFPTDQSDLMASELNSLLNDQTMLTQYTQAIHSKQVIAGFMLILQNAFSGLLFAFVIVLLFVILIVLSHSIRSTIASDFVNMGILKTVGFTANRLRLLQLFQYGIPTVLGLMIGFLLSIPLGELVAHATLTTTGVLIPKIPPLLLTTTAFISILLLLTLFIFIKTRKIDKITPMNAIQEKTNSTITQIKNPAAFGDNIYFRLALRQLISGKGNYIGAFVIALLLVFFSSVVGRIDTWLGSDGKGMMDAFHPADHDIGVQSFGELTQEEFENTIRRYSNITDTYVLAMPTISLNGISYTANVIDEPERFHMLEGRPCIADYEIVITEFIATNLDIAIGDSVTVRGDNKSAQYVVSGIYSCANDMGDNFGMNRKGYLKIGSDHPNLWCWHYFLEDSSQKSTIIRALESAYGGDIHVHENTWSGLFGIISAMQALVSFMYSLVTVFILIVTVMTGDKLLSAEQKDLSIYQAIGFSSTKLRLTFALRFAIISIFGGMIGMVFAIVITDPLVSSVMKLAGISNFVSHPNFIGVISPVIVVTALFTVFSWLLAGKIKKVPLTVLATA